MKLIPIIKSTKMKKVITSGLILSSIIMSLFILPSSIKATSSKSSSDASEHMTSYHNSKVIRELRLKQKGMSAKRFKMEKMHKN